MAYKQELCEPDIRMYVYEHEDCYEISLTGNGFIPFVEMDFEDADDLRNRLRIRCVR